MAIRSIGYDRWNATQLVNQLAGDGFELVPVGQGYASLSAPAKRLEADIAAGLVHHDGNPVLTWNVSNAMAVSDPAGNRKIDKSKSRFRIDGVVAMAMALGLKSRDLKGKPKQSKYEREGIRVI